MPTVLTAMRTGTDDDSLEQYLARSAIFRGIGPDKLRVFAEASELRAYNVLDEAVIEGVTPSSLSIVISGRFVVLLPGKRLARFGDSAMVNLDCYLPGDSFGETALSLHECTSPPASIVATEVSRVFSIDGKRFQNITSRDDKIAHVVYRNLFAIQTRRLAATGT